MIPLSEIYDKDINFLLGSGASVGLFPTLRLGFKKPDGENWSLEDLAMQFEQTADARYIPLFMHYYASCIRPAQLFDISTVAAPVGLAVLNNYRSFLETILASLQRRRVLDRRCNLFTTNYDGCLPLVADDLLQRGSYDFILNDGTRGFRRKWLEARNFNNFLCHSGIFDRHVSSVPQINLIHLHGSVYWRKSKGHIEVDYTINTDSEILDPPAREALQPFSAALADPATTLESLQPPPCSPAHLSSFWSHYQQIPVVNPTKWKFHETVYEEHYYQMLRLLSYELEKPNAVLVTFGFSFADEHILNLVKRSLSNPHLQVFVCCYDTKSFAALQEQFRFYKNVQCITLAEGKPLDFAAFNNEVLTEKPTNGQDANTTVSAVQQPASLTVAPAS